MTAIIVAGLLLSGTSTPPKSKAPSFDTALDSGPADNVNDLQTMRLEKQIVPSQTLAMTSGPSGGAASAGSGIQCGIATLVGGGLGGGGGVGSGKGPRLGMGPGYGNRAGAG